MINERPGNGLVGELQDTMMNKYKHTKNRCSHWCGCSGNGK